MFLSSFPLDNLNAFFFCADFEVGNTENRND